MLIPLRKLLVVLLLKQAFIIFWWNHTWIVLSHLKQALLDKCLLKCSSNTVIENFKNFETCPYFVCLPAVRPTSGRRIGSVFSHIIEYQHANIDLLFQLRFIHYAMVNPFILYCFPFSLTGERKGEKSLKSCQWIVWLIIITSR